MSGIQRRRIAGEAKPELQSEPAETRKPRISTRRPSGGLGGPTGAGATLQSPATTPEESLPSVPAARRPLAGIRSPKTLALVGLLALSIAFGVFGSVTGIQTWRAGDPASARSAAEDAAATSAETIFTYRYDRLPQYLSAAQATMTPANAKKFKSVFPAFNKLVPQRRIQMKGVVRNAAAVECGETCSPDKVTVLVFLDQARLADGLKKATVFPLRFKMLMVKRNGRWLVGDIKSL
jgi:Mce-associated membrane protein